MSISTDGTSVAYHPVELLQQLIRFDTTNPPGNEAECINYIRTLLTEAGISSTILAKDPARPNLIARLPGRGETSPLLVYAHIDVVTTENQSWKYPPFEAQIADGCVWGRGAFDDKGGVTMSLCAALRMKKEGWLPPGDVVLAITCDEERGGTYGSKFLVENHPGLFSGIHYAISETGGFTLYINKQKFYPIMVAEKQFFLINLIVRGNSFYATSGVIPGGTAARVGALLTRIDKGRLPAHITPVARQMIEIFSRNMPVPANMVMSLLLRPALTDRIFSLLGKSRLAISPLLHNTSVVVGVNGGEQALATPSKIIVQLALGVLPGCSLDQVVGEIRAMTRAEFEYEATFIGEPGPVQPNLGLFDTLVQILREGDPQGVPMPLMLTAPTDARIFNRLGIQTYGFQPFKIPPGIGIEGLSHAANERVPVEALDFGIDAMYKLLQRFT